MAVSDSVRKRVAWATGLRALLILIFGIYCVIWPGAALTSLVIVGAVLLLIAGGFGLWALTFGGVKTSTYWWDVIRNALAVIVGVLILISPLMGTLLTATFLLTLIGIEAIFFGVVEIFFVVRERDAYERIWPQVLQGVFYILFGIALVFWPMLGALVGVLWLGILMIVVAIGLFVVAWRLYPRT